MKRAALEKSVLGVRRVLRAVRLGFLAVFRVRRPLLVLLAAEAAVAALATAPFLVAADRALRGYPRAADSVPSFDWVFWTEWTQNRPEVAETLGLGIAVAAAAALLLQALFTGGLLETLERGDSPGAGVFLERAARRFFPLLRLLAASLVLYWLFGRVWDWTVEKAYDAFVEKRISSGAAAFGWTFGRAAAFAAGFLLLRLGADYGRVRLVVEGRRSAVFALLDGFRFLGRRFGGAVSAAGLVAVAEAAALALLALLDGVVPVRGWAGLVVVFVLAHVFLLARLAGRTASLGAAHAYFCSVRDEWTAERAQPEGLPISAPIPEPYEDAEWA